MVVQRDGGGLGAPWGGGPLSHKPRVGRGGLRARPERRRADADGAARGLAAREQGGSPSPPPPPAGGEVRRAGDEGPPPARGEGRAGARAPAAAGARFSPERKRGRGPARPGARAPPRAAIRRGLSVMRARGGGRGSGARRPPSRGAAGRWAPGCGGAATRIRAGVWRHLTSTGPARRKSGSSVTGSTADAGRAHQASSRPPYP
jgi:hypothetical protein